MSKMEMEIKELRFQAIVGIHKKEREEEQEIVVDALFLYNYDNEIYVDYEKVKDVIKNFVIKKKFYLLEEAVLEIKDELKKRFPLLQPLKIGITKVDILEDCKVKISG